jgi:hypothetical protein
LEGDGSEDRELKISFFFRELLVCRGEISELIPLDQAYNFSFLISGVGVEIPSSVDDMRRVFP